MLVKRKERGNDRDRLFNDSGGVNCGWPLNLGMEKEIRIIMMNLSHGVYEKVGFDNDLFLMTIGDEHNKGWDDLRDVLSFTVILHHQFPSLRPKLRDETMNRRDIKPPSVIRVNRVKKKIRHFNHINTMDGVSRESYIKELILW